MNHEGGVSIILRPAGPAGEALDQALRAAGFCVRPVSTVFDIVAEAQRAGKSLRHIFVDVDYWGPGEFRLLPLVRREWPATTIVACYSQGFAYKGRVAELVGADAVLSGAEELVQFVESLTPPALSAAPPESPPEPQQQSPQPAAVARASVRLRIESPPVAAAASPVTEPADMPPPPAPEAGRPPASPLQSIPIMPPQAPPQPQHAESEVADAADDDDVAGEVIGTIELTDEELRLLLGEDEEA
jgi:hypothetical protein